MAWKILNCILSRKIHFKRFNVRLTARLWSFCNPYWSRLWILGFNRLFWYSTKVYWLNLMNFWLTKKHLGVSSTFWSDPKNPFLLKNPIIRTWSNCSEKTVWMQNKLAICVPEIKSKQECLSFFCQPSINPPRSEWK